MSFAICLKHPCAVLGATVGHWRVFTIFNGTQTYGSGYVSAGIIRLYVSDDSLNLRRKLQRNSELILNLISNKKEDFSFLAETLKSQATW